MTAPLASIFAERRTREGILCLAAAFEHLSEAILIADRDGVILHSNNTLEHIPGFGQKEAKGNLFDMLARKAGEPLRKQIWNDLLLGKTWVGRFADHGKNGSPGVVEARVSLLQGAEGEPLGFVAVLRDRTHELDLEARLRQSQKLETIGLLAGGIAHDFNNLLQVIISYGQMMQADLPKDSLLLRDVSRILDAGSKAADLTRQMLAFSRYSEPVNISLDVRLLIEQTAMLLERTLPKSIGITHSFEEPLPSIAGDPGQIHQVILNLCLNARDAMPEGGEVAIRATSATLKEDDCKPHAGVMPGRFLVISVADSGCGIPPEDLPHIFDPFFTTKAEDKGTGLGLATVHDIIGQLGGFITCSGRPGGGTVFAVHIPSHSESFTEGGRPAMIPFTSRS
jgi:PAS domain S-box-containing protein